MAEVTRVPLQPIAKGSVAKLWIGIALAIAAAAGIAWAAVPAGIDLETLRAGSGPTATDEDVVFVKYTGRLEDGTVFDESTPLPIPEGLLPEGSPFPVSGGVIEGFAQGLKQMQKGGRYILEIPGRLAYGETPPPGSDIPPNADLEFEDEVVDIMQRSDFEGRIAMLQQMMQQQGAPGGPGAGPAGAPPQNVPGPPPGN